MFEFSKVIIPGEIEALCDFDRRAFHRFPADVFSEDMWRTCESYWLIVDGITVGCTALQHNLDYNGQPRKGCLYILSTGVLPEFLHQGFGIKQKEFQIEYAKKHGFNLIVTNMRQSNEPIIRLNEKFGFKTRKICPDYYPDPIEPAIVMELELPVPSGLCPHCGKPLRTLRAKQCRFCHRDWH